MGFFFYFLFSFWGLKGPLLRKCWWDQKGLLCHIKQGPQAAGLCSLLTLSTEGVLGVWGAPRTTEQQGCQGSGLAGRGTVWEITSSLLKLSLEGDRNSSRRIIARAESGNVGPANVSWHKDTGNRAYPHFCKMKLAPCGWGEMLWKLKGCNQTQISICLYGITL